MERYFIRLAYDGTNYHGWQIQDNAHTIQAEINEKLSKILGQQLNVVGCGRTDAGVHARVFYAHFDIEKLPLDPKTLSDKLDRFLPPDIVILDVFEVKPDFHARFDAKSRTYRYYISRRKDPFHIDSSYFYRGQLNIDQMKESCASLFEYTDFTSFSKLHTQTATNLCAIEEAEWTVDDDKLVFTITADRFLRNMVRAIVGTMMEIGKGKISALDMKRIIEMKDRAEAGYSVPAAGLFLENVTYDFKT